MRSGLAAVVVLVMLACSAAPADAFRDEPAEPLELPDGCVRETDRLVTCTWSWSFSGTTVSAQVPLAWLPANVIDARFVIDSTWGYGWSIVDEQTGERFVSEADYSGSEMHGTYFLDFRPGHDAVLDVRVWVGDNGAVPPLTVDAVLVFELTAPREPAGGAAGSPTDPHVVDAVGDTRGPRFTDVAGAWFDDPFLDDGLIEVGVLAPHLDEARADIEEQVSFEVAWSILGERYVVRWLLHNESSPVGAATINANGTWTAYLAKSGGAERVMELVPHADEANGTLTTRLALRTIGDPAPGILFTNMSAAGSVRVLVRGISYPGAGTVEFPIPAEGDEATENVRPFGVGGPAVWARLRGDDGAGSSGALAWYQAPFARENLPDTLEVLGALAAVATAVGGLLLMRRRREALARLMDDVDAVLEVHADDPDAALRALEGLERRFERMVREGKIDESRHALLLAKIERAGYRLMRERKDHAAPET